MKCDYCEKETKYSCEAYLLEGVVNIYACEEHLAMAVNKQQSLLLNERVTEKTKI